MAVVSKPLVRRGGEVARKASSGDKCEGSGRGCWDSVGNCWAGRRVEGAVTEREKGGSWAASANPVAVAELWSLDGGAMAAMEVLAPFTDVCGGGVCVGDD